MDWDKHEATHFSAKALPVDMGSPPRLGDHARLTRDGHDFDVEITSITDAEFHGEVRAIGPSPVIEALGIERGAHVCFRREHIQTLYRK